MISTVVKRSIVIAGHRTSISLEDTFWKALKDIAKTRGETLSEIVAAIDDKRQDGKYDGKHDGKHGGNLSSAIRVFVLDHYRR
jgi:predicted DNA-binding ribbon-helix-helix protein